MSSYRLVRITGMLLVAVCGPALCAGCGTQIGIEASPSVLYIGVGGSMTVNVQTVMDSGSPTVVAVPLTITSSDDAIVTVSALTATGVSEGDVILTITDGVFTTTAAVFVVSAGTIPSDVVVTPASISCTPSSDDTQLEVFAVLTTGPTEDVTDLASYGSGDTSVALVTAEGRVVCVAEGVTAITAEYLGASGTVGVVVGSIAPRSVSFSSPALACQSGEWHPVVVIASWEDGSTTDVSLSADYTSTDEMVAVATLGQVHCVSEGSAVIITSVGGTIDSLVVTVEPAPGDPDTLVDLSVVPSDIDCTLTQGFDLTVLAEFGDGSTEDVTTDGQTRLESSDSTVALLLDERVVCVQQGQATIEVTHGDLTASVAVMVR